MLGVVGVMGVVLSGLALPVAGNKLAPPTGVEGDILRRFGIGRPLAAMLPKGETGDDTDGEKGLFGATIVDALEEVSSELNGLLWKG